MQLLGQLHALFALLATIVPMLLLRLLAHQAIASQDRQQRLLALMGIPAPQSLQLQLYVSMATTLQAQLVLSVLLATHAQIDQLQSSALIDTTHPQVPH